MPTKNDRITLRPVPTDIDGAYIEVGQPMFLSSGPGIGQGQFFWSSVEPTATNAPGILENTVWRVRDLTSSELFFVYDNRDADGDALTPAVNPTAVGDGFAVGIWFGQPENVEEALVNRQLVVAMENIGLGPGNRIPSRVFGGDNPNVRYQRVRSVVMRNPARYRALYDPYADPDDSTLLAADVVANVATTAWSPFLTPSYPPPAGIPAQRPFTSKRVWADIQTADAVSEVDDTALLTSDLDASVDVTIYNEVFLQNLDWDIWNLEFTRTVGSRTLDYVATGVRTSDDKREIVLSANRRPNRWLGQVATL